MTNVCRKRLIKKTMNRYMGKVDVPAVTTAQVKVAEAETVGKKRKAPRSAKQNPGKIRKL